MFLFKFLYLTIFIENILGNSIYTINVQYNFIQWLETMLSQRASVKNIKNDIQNAFNKNLNIKA